MKMLLEIIKWVVLISGGLLLYVFISLQVYRTYVKYSTKIDTPDGISSLEEIKLGGEKQWIFIRGTNQNNPVLVFLHGGPGMPVFGMASSRELDVELIEHFTVVHWDQRGTGKSYNDDLTMDSITIDRLAEDCNELIDYLRYRFNTQKVFLVGHSWGSVIGIKTVSKYPEKIHAFVGVGQIIDDYERQMTTYNFIVEESEKSDDVIAQNAIAAIGPPPFDTPEELKEKDSYIAQYGGVMHGVNPAQMGIIMFNFLTSPEYSLSEGFQTVRMKGMDFTTRALWDEMQKFDLTKEIESIQVPIYFFEGKHDMANPTILIEDFIDKLDESKDVNLIIFEKSGHFPMIEEKEKYQDQLINVVLKESQNE